MYEVEKRSGLSQKERVRRRIHTQIDQENYTFFPAKEPRDFFGESSRLSVAVYARVSTGNVEQTSSYELQKKYYEDYVRRHPNWTLARIYADATDIIGLKQNPTNGRRFSPIFVLSGHFSA